MKFWFVYIAKTSTNKYYTGITTDPKRRVVQHNAGKGALMALEQGPFEIVYVSRPFANKSQARRREIQVKDWSQEKKLKLISGRWQ
jgi:putative endonuclease